MSEHYMDTMLSLSTGMSSAALAGLRILVIVVVAWLLITVLQRTLRAFRVRIASRFDEREAVKRAETLGRVFRYLAAVVVSMIAGLLVLGEIGISLAPILGAAAVVGLAVGFGAQSLVKDYFAGFFILLEKQISEGDVIKLGDHAGLVEVVTLRYVQLRDHDGHVHFVLNGMITTVVNMSRGFAQAVMDIGVAYRENTDEVIPLMPAEACLRYAGHRDPLSASDRLCRPGQAGQRAGVAAAHASPQGVLTRAAVVQRSLGSSLRGNQRSSMAAARSRPPMPKASASPSTMPPSTIRKVCCTRSPPMSMWSSAISSTKATMA